MKACNGAFDFSVQKGEEWLVVGHRRNGVVRPFRDMSAPITDGKIPAAYAEYLLDRN